MRSRDISCAILGGLLGFAGQFLADHASPKGLKRFTGSPSEVIITTSNIPSGLSGDPPYSFVYYANGRSVGTPYQLLDGTPAYPGLPQNVPCSISIAKQNHLRGRLLSSFARKFVGSGEASKGLP